MVVTAVLMIMGTIMDMGTIMGIIMAMAPALLTRTTMIMPVDPMAMVTNMVPAITTIILILKSLHAHRMTTVMVTVIAIPLINPILILKVTLKKNQFASIAQPIITLAII